MAAECPDIDRFKASNEFMEKLLRMSTYQKSK